jgi:hypothetical protein
MVDMKRLLKLRIGHVIIEQSYKIDFIKYTIFISSTSSNFASFILHFSFLGKLIGIRSVES